MADRSYASKSETPCPAFKRSTASLITSGEFTKPMCVSSPAPASAWKIESKPTDSSRSFLLSFNSPSLNSTAVASGAARFSPRFVHCSSKLASPDCVQACACTRHHPSSNSSAGLTIRNALHKVAAAFLNPSSLDFISLSALRQMSRDITASRPCGMPAQFRNKKGRLHSAKRLPTLPHRDAAVRVASSDQPRHGFSRRGWSLIF